MNDRHTAVLQQRQIACTRKYRLDFTLVDPGLQLVPVVSAFKHKGQPRHCRQPPTELHKGSVVAIEQDYSLPSTIIAQLAIPQDSRIILTVTIQPFSQSRLSA
jgi:hypothetical protein